MSAISDFAKELRELVSSSNPISYVPVEARNKILKAADVIEILHKKTELENGWIPCGERLPDSNGMYLITAEVLKKEEVQYSWFQKDAEIFICNGIATAWMPLPEPYNE